MHHVLHGELAVKVAELGRRILAGMHSCDEGTAGMAIFPLRKVVDLAADDDPAVLERTVLCHLGARDLAIAAE